MPELTDAQKVMRNDTGKSIAEAIANMSITVAGQEIEVSDTEPQGRFVDVWFQEQQQGTPVEVYTVPEINDMIAPAETSPTQAAHHVGEYIICVINGQAKLYKVITEISAGETLTVGGNISAVQNGGFNDLITTSTAPALSTSLTGWAIVRSHLYKVGRIAILNMVVTRSANAANNGTLLNLPAGYLPIDTFEGRENDLEHTSYCNYQVSSTGAFTVQAGPDSTAISVRIDMTYITK